MSENSDREQKNFSEEDEISLVDLIAVLIRFRRMILGGTLLVFAGSVAWWYGVYPAVQKESPPEPSYIAEHSLEVRGIPPQLRGYIEINPLALAQALLSDPRVTGDATITSSYDRNTQILTVQHESGDGTAAQRTLVRAIQEADARLTQRVAGGLAEAEQRITGRVTAVGNQLGEIVDSTAGVGTGEAVITPQQILQYLSLAITMDNAVQAFREEADLLEQVRLLEAAPCMICPLLEEPLIREATPVEPGSTRRSVRVVVSTVAALFLLVFIAFVRQYIRTVAADQEESRKLRDAWKGD